MSRYAVVDLGTNTCNILITNILQNGSFETVYDRKLPVKLGMGGIHKDIMLPDAIERGISALYGHSVTIREYDVQNVKIVGTSAIRGAANRSDFLAKVKQLLGWEIEILDGDLEAALIFRGVRLSLPDGIGKYLIVDIGGGSIEFILANDNNITWKNSFNIGIARALEIIPVSDPVTPHEILMLEQWFDSQLKGLWEICDTQKPLTLVGCSGAFDTFMDIYESAMPDLKVRGFSYFPIEGYRQIHDQLIKSDLKTRGKMKGMDEMRIDMIVVASVFTNFIIEKLQVKKLAHTHNSLKEGVMDRLISKGL